MKEEGSAAKRAGQQHHQQMAGRDDDDDDDDVDAIRKANAKAGVKRQHKVEQQEKAARKKANKANAEFVKVSAQGGSSGQANPAHNKAGLKAEKANKSQGNTKDQAAKSTSAQKQQRTNGGDKKKKPASEEDEEDDDEDDRQENSDDSDSSSDDDDDDDDDEGLSMLPRAQQKNKGKQESSDDSDGSDFDELNVVFDSFDPKEDDFHGIKVFLTELLDGEAFDSSGLVDEVLANSVNVGTVVKVQDAEEVFGVMSVVSLRESKKETWAQQVEAFILSKCPPSLKSKLDKYVGPDATSHGGLIISERLANMPQEMALPMMRTTFDEIKQAKKELVSLLCASTCCFCAYISIINDTYARVHAYIFGF